MPEKRSLGRRVFGFGLRVLVASLIAFPPSVWANPVLDSVAAGSADVSSAGSTLTVVQHSNNAIINWTDFSIAHGELTNFIQPSAMSAALNRVTGGNVSAIYGTLQANGRIFLINPNGVMVGPTGVINTQSFVASTLDVNSAAFLSGGAMTFSGASAASVVNAGSINALGGDAVLIARTVQNTGKLIAADGLAAMAAGSEVLLMPSGTERVFVKAGSGESAVGVDQKGEIAAATAELKAAGGNVYGLAINNAGIIRANGVERRGGRVYLTAEGGNIALRSGSVIDASGENGGGTVLVGGDSEGANPLVPNASQVVIEEGATIKADATVAGDGGKVVVWGNDSTSFKGSISAKGGAQGGDGGSVEVSGGYLAFDGMVDVTAPTGLLGSLLLDPFDLVIQTAGPNTVTIAGQTDTSGVNTSVLTVATLQSQLGTANVTVQTGNGGAQQGNITVANAVTWNTGSTLNLRAHNNIVQNSGAAITATGNGGVTMLANSNGGNNGASITLNSGVVTGSGSQSYTAGSNGAINLNANNTTGSGAQSYNSAVVLQTNETVTSNGAVTFSGAVNGTTAGSQSLTVAGSGNVTFSNGVGGTTRLGALNVNGTGTANLNGTLNTGAETYAKAVNLASNSTINSNNGAVAFNSTVNGSNTLAVNAGTGDVTFGGTVGGTTQLDGLTVTGSGTTNLNGGAVSINGTGNVALGEKVALGADTTINANGGDTTFSGTVNGNKALTVNAGNGGNININGLVGNTAVLTSLALTGTGATTMGAGATAVTTSGSQSWGEAVTFGGNTALNTTNSAISFGGSANGTTADAQSLTLNAGSGNVSLGSVGTTRRFSSFAVNNTGTLGLNGTVNTNAAQNYTQALILNGNSGLTTNNQAITLGSTVNGASAGGQTLTLNAGSANTNITGVIGGVNRLGGLTVNGTGTTNLNTASAINAGSQAYNQNVVLGQNTTLNSNGGTVDFNANLNGASADAQSLTINAGIGNVSFSNAGTTQRLQSVAVTGTGGLDLNGTINTNGAQSYSQAINLSGNSVLTTNNAAVTLGGAVNANNADVQSLTINAGNAPVSLASVGVTRRLSSFALNNTGGLTLNGTINTSQAQTYNEAVTLAGNSGFSTNNQAITLNGTVDGTTTGGQSLTLNAGTAATNLNSALGGTKQLGALTVNGSGTTNVNTTTINTGAETFNQAVNLQQNVTFNSNGGAVAFNGGVNADVADTRNLTVNAGAGAVNLGNIGVTRRINSLALTAGSVGLNGTVNTNAGQTYTTAVTLNGNSTLQTNNGAITLNGTVNGSNTLTLNAGSGNVNLNGTIGNTSAIDALTISGTGATNLNTTSIKTNGTGAQTYGETVNLLQNTALTTNGGAVVFSKTVDGAKSLTIDSTGGNNDGNVTFGGAVGGGTALSSLIINQSNIGGNGGGGSGIVYINGQTVTTNGAQTYGDEIIMNANTVLNSNGGAFYFNDHVNGVATGAQSLAVNAGAGNIFFNRRVGGDHALSSLTIGAGTGTTDIDTGGIQTTGNQLYGQNVALTNDPDFTTTGGNITFMGTINGGHDILMSPVGGNVVFNGAVGGATALNSLTITGTGKTTVNGGLVRTVNDQSWGEDVVLGADTTINATGAGNVSFSKTVNGAKNLTVTPNSGSVTFTGAVGDVTHLTSLTVNAGNNAGTTNLNDSQINTDGNQTYGQKVLIGGNETLGSNGGNVLFSNTVNGNGARTLAINAAAGNVTFSNTVGAATALTSLAVTGTGTTNLNGTSVRTTGNQTYGEKVQLGTDNLVSATTNGNISFSDTVNGARNLTATTGGQVAFNGIVGGNTALTSLTSNGAGGTTNVNTTAINTTGAQSYNATTISQNAVLTSVNGPVGFNSTLNAATDGVQSLTVTDGGVTSFNGIVGGVKKLSALTTNGAGTTNVNTTAITTTGDQNYNAMTLSQNAVLTATNNGAINFNGTVNAATDGVQSLTATTGGQTAFNGVVGGVKKLSALTTNGVGGTTNVNTTAINTTGAQNYNAAKISQNAVLTATANGAINLNGTVNAAADGVQSLTATTGGQAAFNGVVGGVNKLAALTTNGAGTTNINTTAINTTGAQNYNATTVSQNALLTSVNGPVNFNSTLNAATDGVQSLTVTDGGVTSFNGIVGGVKKLSALTTNGAGTTNINTTAITTTGDQNYNATTLSQNAVLTATNNGALNFNGTVNAATDGVQSLTATTGGQTAFNGVVGGVKKLSALTTNGVGGTTNVNTTAINTTGAQNYNAAKISQNAVLTATANGAINLNGTVNAAADGVQSLTATTGGQAAFNGVVGGVNKLAALTTNGAGTTNINTTAITTTGDQNYNATTVSQNAVLTATNNGAINLNGTVNAATDGVQSLTATTGGQAAFNGIVGGVKKLAALTTNGAGTTNINTTAINTTGAQNYNATTLSQTAALTGGSVNFNGTLDAATDGVQGLTAAVGAASFNGLVGASKKLAALTTTGGTTNVNTTAINTTGAQNYDATTLSQTAALTGGAVNFNGTLDAATDGVQGLTATAGTASFNGLVGSSKKLASLTTTGGSTNINTTAITTTGDQNYDATTLSQTAALTSSNNGAINFNGTLDAAADGVQGLTAATGGTASFNGLVGSSKKLASLTTSGGSTNVNTTAINTTGAQNYDATTLSQTAALTGGAVNFNGTLDAATDGVQGLTAAAGTASFNGLVGSSKKLASLTTTGGSTVINAAAITTTGDQNYDAMTLSQDAALTSAAGGITLASVNGAKALTTNSAADTTVNGAINTASLDATAATIRLNNGSVVTTGDQTYRSAVSAPGVIDLTAGGNINLNGGSVASAGAQGYHGKVHLGTDDNLTGAGVTFDSTINGAHALTVDSGAGDAVLNGAVGDAEHLTSLTLNGSGVSRLNGALVNTDGAQSYNEAVSLGVNTTLNSNGGTVGFAKTLDGIVDGAQDLAISAGAGNVNFLGAVGDIHPLRSLTIGAGSGTTDINGGRITTIGAQSYGQKVVLSDDAWLASNGGAVTFYETVDGTVIGQQGLTVDGGTGNITFYKDIGASVPLKYLTLIGTGRHSIYGEVNTTGDQNFFDDLFLTANLTLRSHGGHVFFHKRVNGDGLGPWALLVDADTGDIDFAGVIGDIDPLASLTLLGTGLTTLSGGSVKTVGAQSYGEAVALGADTTLSNTAGKIEFAKTVSGANALTVNAGGDANFLGAVNIASLDATAGGLIDVNGGSVLTSGDQVYNTAAVLSADAALTSNAGKIDFLSTLTGPFALTTNSAFGTKLGGATNLGSVDMTAGGDIALDGGSVITSGAQNYRTAVQLGADAALTGASIVFDGAVDGAKALTTNSVADTAFGGIVNIASLDATAGGLINLNNGSVITTGAQTYQTAVQLGADNALSGGAITFNGAISGAKALTTNSVADTSINGAVNIASLDATAGGSINLNNGAIVTTGDQTYNTAVALTGDSALNANKIDFLAAITGNKALTTNSAADTNFDGTVNIGSLGATAGGLINLNNGSVITTGAQTYQTAVQLGANGVLTGDAITFNGTIGGAKSLTTNSAADTALNGAVNVASLDATAGGLINLNAGTVVTTGGQTYNTAVALTGDNSLTGSKIDFLAAITGNKALTTNSTLDTTFGGAINIASLDATAGGLINLNNGSVITTGAQTYETAVQLGADNALSGNAITFNGAINGAKALTTNSVVDTTVNGAINIASLDATAGGNINLNNGSVVTTGAQTYETAVQLGADNTLTGGAITFNGTIGGAKGLTTSSVADTTVNGAVNIASIDATAGGSINLNAGTIATTGDQTYRTAVNLTGANALTAGGKIDFLAAITGNNALTTDSTLDTNFDGAINIGSLDATAGGLINLNDGLVTTAGAQLYRTAVNLGADGVLTGDAITANGAIGGAKALTTNSVADTSLNGAVNIASLDATAGGSINLNAGTIATTGDQTYNTAAVLTGDNSLTGSKIDFLAAITGNKALTTNSTLDTAFGGAINIASLDATAGGLINLNGGSVVTTGAQTYETAVQLGADSALNGSAITFNGAINGAKALTTNSAADTTVNGAINIASLDATAGGNINLNDGSVVTTGAQTYQTAVHLGADNTLTGGAITFNGAISGAKGLTTNSVADTTVNGAVNIASLDATAGGSINLNNGSIVTTGDQTYNTAVALTGDSALNANKIDFLAAITGNKALTTNSAADTNFDGTVNIGSLDATAGGLINLNNGLVTTSGDMAFRSAVAAPGSIDLTAGGLIKLGGPSVATVGAQTYETAVQLGADNALTGDAITFNGAITGNKSLTTSSTLGTAFGGAVNIGSLDATAGGGINLNTGTIATTGDQAYRSAVNLTGANALTSGGKIDFLAAITGDKALTTNSGADTNFDGIVNIGSLDATAGGLINLNNGSVVTSGDLALNSAVAAPGAIDLTAGGLIKLGAGTITSVGAQTYETAVSLTGDDALTGAGVAFNSTINGAHALTIDSLGGETDLRDAVGDNAALTGLTINGSGVTRLDGGVVNTAGNQTYNEAVQLGANTTLNSNDGTVAFATKLDGAHDLTINAGAGDINFLGAVGDDAALGALTLTGTGTTDINGGRITTTGAQSYGEKVVLSDDAWLASNGGAVTFFKTVDGTVIGQQGLTVDAGAGDITFWGDVGASVALEYLHLLGTGRHILYGALGTVGDQDYFDDFFLFHDLSLYTHGGKVTFHKRVNGAYNLLIAADSGDINFQGVVGDIDPLASLTLIGTGITNLTGGSVKTSGNQSYGEAVVLGADTALAASTGKIEFQKSVTGAQALTVNAGGDANFLGAVDIAALDATAGGLIDVNGGSVLTSGDQIYRTASVLSADATLTSNNGKIDFLSTLAGPYALTVNAAQDATLGGAVSVGSLDMTAGGNLNLAAGSIGTTGAQTYNSAVVLTGDDSLTGSKIDFLAAITGSKALTTNSGADTNYNGTVNIGSLNATAGGLINLNNGSVVTSGDQAYNTAVSGPGAIALTSGGVIKLDGGSITAAGDLSLNGAVTGAGAIAFTSGGDIKLNAPTIVTAGAQTYDGAVVLGGDAAMTASKIDFLSTITGAHALTTNSTLATAFDGAVSVASLDATAGGGVVLNNGSVTTTGGQTYDSAVSGPGAITLASGGVIKLDGGSISAGGDLTLDGAVTGAGSIDFASGGDIYLRSVTTAGDQTYGAAVLGLGAVNLTAGGAINLNGGSITTADDSISLDGAVSAPGSLVLDAGLGDVSWKGSVSALDLQVFGYNLIMRGDLAASGANGVLLVAGHSFQNLGFNTITNTGGGRWLVYSVNPNLNIKGGLNGMEQWSTSYKNGPLPDFAGDGFLYTDAKPVDPIVIDINLGAINNIPGGNNGNNGVPGFFGDFSSGDGGYVADNWSASPSDIFNWDLGTVRDAVASPDDESPAARRKRKAAQAKKKSIWFKVPGE